MMPSSICIGRGCVTYVITALCHVLNVDAAWLANHVTKETREESEDIWYVLSVSQQLISNDA